MLMTPRRSLLVATLLAFVGLALPPNGSAAEDDSVERLNRFLAETHSLRSEFRQTRYDEDMQLLEEASGVVLLSRPGRFRWTYRRPYEQDIVSNGERVWIYDADLNQVTVGDFDSSIEASPAMLLGVDRPLDDYFEVKGLGRQDGLHWVQLLPRSAESTFEVIRIALDARGLRMMELRDAFGQLTRLAFEKVQRNAAIDGSRFRFIPPAGADVVQR